LRRRRDEVVKREKVGLSGNRSNSSMMFDIDVMTTMEMTGTKFWAVRKTTSSMVPKKMT